MQEGIIAAGLANGSIEVWDPAKLAAGKGEAARITKLDKHKGPVGVPKLSLHDLSTACSRQSGYHYLHARLHALTDSVQPTRIHRLVRVSFTVHIVLCCMTRQDRMDGISIPRASCHLS